MTATRRYRSPAREEGKLRTREAILEALVRVVLDDGIHAFSVANVAARAGVSHRTVYRHFPTKEALLDALSDHVDAGAPGAGGPDEIALDALPATVTGMFAALADARDAATAAINAPPPAAGTPNPCRGTR